MLARRLAVSFMALTVLACGDDDDDSVAIFAEAEIGPAGGSLTSGDGRASLRVASGALADTVGFFVDSATDPLPAGAMGPGYLFGPEATLLEPGHVSLTFDPGDVPPGGEHALRVATSTDGGVDWFCIAAMAASVGDGFANAVTSHLSDWALVLATCDDASPCQLPEKCLDPDAEGNRYCAIPCIDTANCPAPMACDTDVHACRSQVCADGAGCTGDSSCSADEGHGICDAGPTECATLPEQFAYTAAGKCLLQNKCTVVSPDDAVTPCEDLGLTAKYCYHGWCVEQSVGCACGDPGCPCTD